MVGYYKFIPQNVAIRGAKQIGIYNDKGSRVGHIPLGNLAIPSGNKLYSFGALSDVHYQYDTAPEDFHRALTYLNDSEDVAFTCICGDMTSGGTDAELTAYKNAVATYSPDTPVYSMMGNHDVRASLMDSIQNYTGNPNYYSINYGNDVFIFVGNVADWTTNVLSKEELQWLYQTLEANRNKRCFLFEHIRPTNGCGNALGLYKRSNITDWGGNCGTVFEGLLSHYKNVIFFHGHSHLKFYLQEHDKLANYDNIRGSHSVHIPSLAVPRDSDWATDPSTVDVYADSEGYVVDVYENGIHLRGRDFTKGEFMPIASYWLDTTIKIIEANGYHDNTGMLEEVDIGTPINIPWIEGYTAGGSSGTSISADSNYITTEKISLEDGYQYTISIGQNVNQWSLYTYYYTSDGAALGRNEAESFAAGDYGSDHTGKFVVLSPKSGAVTFRLQSWCGGQYDLVKNNVTITKLYVG